MANTPFIQFPCGEWVSGYGPDDEPCDPMVPGDCDDPDVRHPTCPECPSPPGVDVGWACIDNICQFVEGGNYATIQDCLDAGCGDQPPPGPPPGPPPPGPPPPGPPPPGPPPPGPGPGGPPPSTEDWYIELCPCEGGDECIKQVGTELVQYWMDLKKANGKTVILAGAEGDAGGGCTFTGEGLDFCEVCVCWEIGDPINGTPQCKEPDVGDGSPSGIIDGITNNINNGTHCPDDLKARCHPEDCEAVCPPAIMCGGGCCPGCKPWEDDEDPVVPPPVGGACFCELVPGKSGKYGMGQPQITCEPIDCGISPNPDLECECAECKVYVTFKQQCVEQSKTTPDSGAAGAEVVAKQEFAKNGYECIYYFKDKPPNEVICIDEICGWEKEPGGDCECPGTGAVKSNEPPCPPAIYTCCWGEVWCTEGGPPSPGGGPPGGGGPGFGGPFSPGGGGGGQVAAPSPGGTGQPCFCVPKITASPPAPPSPIVDCPPECCKDGCDPGQKCKGKKKAIHFDMGCVKNGQIHWNDKWCGVDTGAMEQKCKCVNKKNNQSDCPQGNVVIAYVGCQCGGGDNTDIDGPCDPAGTGEGTGEAGSGGQSGRGGAGNSGNNGGNLNHEVGGNTGVWSVKALKEYQATGRIVVGKYLTGYDRPVDFKDPNKGNRAQGIPYSPDMRSDFQVNLKLLSQNIKTRDNRKEYGGNFQFKTNEYNYVRKNRGVISNEIEIRSEEFRAAIKNKRFTNNPSTPRGQRTTSTLYNDQLTIFDYRVIPDGGVREANQKHLEVFHNSVTKYVGDFLSNMDSTGTWDEKWTSNLTLDNIRQSLNSRCVLIMQSLKLNYEFGISHFDFLRTIREHLLRNTMGELDLGFYETFPNKQSSVPKFVVKEPIDKELLAIQMAITYARDAQIVDNQRGSNAQYASLYRTKASDVDSRITIRRACGQSYVKLNEKDEIPIKCADGTEVAYSFGTLTATENALVIIGQNNCENNIPLVQEKEHSVRLNNKIRDKILKLLDIQHSEQISSETLGTLEVELNYSLTDKLDEYYFFAADYSTTDQIDNYNNSDYLVQFTRNYRRITDIDVINGIIKDQIGATHYVNHDDRIITHSLQSNIIKYSWIDFTLQGFGLDDVTEFPVFQAKNPAYIIIIPTALSENNPFHAFSDLYITGDFVGRRMNLALHVDKTKLTTFHTSTSDGIKVERE